MKMLSYTSDISTVSSKTRLVEVVKVFINKVKYSCQSFRISAGSERADKAPKNLTVILQNCCISLKYKSKLLYCYPQNHKDDRKACAHWTRARVLILATKVPKTFLVEALCHAN